LSQTPNHLHYSTSHQWVAVEADGVVTVGITDFAQEALGDVVFVEFPALNKTVGKDEACAVVESVKSASDVFAPVSGTIIECNAALESSFEKINQSPYEAWLFKIKLRDAKEIETLLTADAYRALTVEQLS
jgi:glycine cleavage system H protein